MSSKDEKGAPPHFTLDSWKKKGEEVKISHGDMNKLVIDFLITEGFKETAEIFQKESLTDTSANNAELLETRTEIRNAIQAGKIEEGVKKVQELNPKILTDQTLNFRLKQQHLIELIRNSSINEALEFAQTQLASFGQENASYLEEIEKTMALLAFENASSSPLASLLDVSHRQITANRINSAILSNLHQKESECQLYFLLNMLKNHQANLEKQKIKFPKIVDFVTANFEEGSPSTSINQ